MEDDPNNSKWKMTTTKNGRRQKKLNREDDQNKNKNGR